MKKTRHPGLYRLPDQRWKLRATATCSRTGRLKEATKTLDFGATEDEALSQLLILKQQLRNGEEKHAQAKKLCVTDYAEQWLKRKAARVRPSVAKNYEAKLGLFILPNLGELLLDQVTRDDVERWVAWAEKARMGNGEPYARETVQGWWRVLRSLLSDAAAEHRLPLDPTHRVTPPKPRGGHRREMRTLTASEVGSLLDALKTCAPDRYAEVYVLCYSGMRAGELYALTWAALDSARGRILVRQSVWNGHVDATKTEEPREVAFPREMAQVIAEHRRRLVAMQHPGLASGIVFPANTGGYRIPQSLHKPLRLAATMAGVSVKVTPQVLRRTFNTLMVQAGVDRIVLRSQMGHSSEEMTRRYAGIPISAKQAALQLLLDRTHAQ